MRRFILSIVLVLGCGLLYAQTEEGLWETFDTKRQKPMSHVRIYKQNGKLYGTVVKVLDDNFATCTRCSGENKNKPTVGLQVIRGLEKHGGKWMKDDGMLDPISGFLLDGVLWMDGTNTLKVKGSLGFLSDTQTWKRIQ